MEMCKEKYQDTHRISSVQDASGKAMGIDFKDGNNNFWSSRLPQCKHSEPKKFSCIPCGICICTDCLFLSHLTCQVIPEQSYIHKLFQERKLENIRYIQGRITEISEREQYFLAKSANMKTAIENQAEKMKMSIDAEKESLLKKVQTIEDVKSRLWRTQRIQCEDALKNICEWKTIDTKSFLQLGKTVNSLVNEMRNFEYAYENGIYFMPRAVAQTKMGKINLLPCAKNTRIETAQKAVAHIRNTCTVSVRDELDELVGDEVDYTLDVAVVDQNDDPVYLTIKNLKNGRFVIDFYPTSAGTLSLFVSLNSYPVIDSPKDICVVEEETEEVQPVLMFGSAGVGDGEFVRPWGVCCDKWGRILVSDRCNHRIQIFTSDGHFHSKFGTEGPGPGQFNRPAGLAVDKFCRIIVADKDNHRVQIFDSDGTYITHFGRFKDEEQSLYYPWDVCVNDQCCIAVTESKKGRVRLFSDSGIMLRSFQLTNKLDLQTPRGITCLSDNTFIITDFDTHKLILLDSNFEHPKTMGSEGFQADKFFRPQCVASNGNDLFAVTDCKNHRIKVFGKNTILEIFGKYGKDPGEFDSPQGIAFHPSGRLVVVDYGNSRIQVFDVSEL